MKGLHISTMCAAIVVIVALVAYHMGGGGKCREHWSGESGVSGYWGKNCLEKRQKCTDSESECTNKYNDCLLTSHYRVAASKRAR